MSTFFVLLLRRYEGTARLPRRSDFFWKHEFSAILTHIQSNFATVTIKSVAQHFHYSDRQIGRIVYSCTGLTFADLVLKLRMDQAVKLLQQKDASVDAVALSVGYASASTFCRAFAKYYGCTPREYKQSRTHQYEIDVSGYFIYFLALAAFLSALACFLATLSRYFRFSLSKSRPFLAHFSFSSAIRLSSNSFAAASISMRSSSSGAI